jgi:hypothetical protein
MRERAEHAAARTNWRGNDLDLHRNVSHAILFLPCEVRSFNNIALGDYRRRPFGLSPAQIAQAHPDFAMGLGSCSNPLNQETSQ